MWKIIGKAVGITVGVIVLVIGLGALFDFLGQGAFGDSWFVAVAQFENEFWTGALFPNGWNLFLAAPLFWGIVLTVLVVVIICLFYYREGRASVGVAVLCIIAAVAVAVFGVGNRIGWFNEDQAKSYWASDSFVVSNPNQLPSIIAKTNPNSIKISKGDISFDWNARSASATGAAIVLQRTSSGVGNTQLLTDTLEYLYNEDGTGVWSAIRNGKN